MGMAVGLIEPAPVLRQLGACGVFIGGAVGAVVGLVALTRSAGVRGSIAGADDGGGRAAVRGGWELGDILRPVGQSRSQWAKYEV